VIVTKKITGKRNLKKSGMIKFLVQRWEDGKSPERPTTGLLTKQVNLETQLNLRGGMK